MVKHLNSFSIAHAAVLMLVVGVFLMDGCVNRIDRHCMRTASDASSMPASKPLDIQRKAPMASAACI